MCTDKALSQKSHLIIYAETLDLEEDVLHVWHNSSKMDMYCLLIGRAQTQ